ncbi:MAG: hypothetical protein JXO72_11010 [Vicinamibacteria bacterium]|nr:hypothetical protein [Vicinamibacteria bacterium]
MIRPQSCLSAILVSGVLAATTSYGNGEAESPAPSEPTRYAVILRPVLGGSTVFQEERRLSTPFDTSAPLDEHGRFGARYDFGAFIGVDAGFRVRLYRHVAMWIDYTIMNREGLTVVDLHLPHPFSPNMMREAPGSDDTFVFRESTLHADIALLFGMGRMQGTLLAGVSCFRVKADLVEDVRYQYVYPYDAGDLTVVSLRRNPQSAAPFGFNCGLNVDLPIGRIVGFGVLLRYSRARVRFVPEPDDEIVANVGGLQASAGLSFYF